MLVSLIFSFMATRNVVFMKIITQEEDLCDGAAFTLINSRGSEDVNNLFSFLPFFSSY